MTGTHLIERRIARAQKIGDEIWSTIEVPRYLKQHLWRFIFWGWLKPREAWNKNAMHQVYRTPLFWLETFEILINNYFATGDVFSSRPGFRVILNPR